MKKYHALSFGTWFIVAAVAFLVVLFAGACGGTSEPQPTSTPSGQEPLDVVRSALDELNQGHIDTAYGYFSSDARKEVSLDEARLVLLGLKLAGTKFSVTIDTIGDITVNGDLAEIELTLRVELGTDVIIVEDEGSLVRENGEWRIADHFLQTALIASGLQKPLVEGSRKLDQNGCAIGDVMLGVYVPSRLQVLDPCITVMGIVRDDIVYADDGDITFGLYVTGDDRQLVNEVNERNYGGALHLEIVPIDQKNVQVPKPGDLIRVTGAWVIDLVHGHTELHPVFRIEFISQ